MRVSQILGLLILVFAGCSGRCQGADSPAAEPPLLQEGKRTSGVVEVEKQSMATFRVSVPKDAVLMTVRLTQCAVPLDIFARKDGPLTSPSDAENRTNSETLETTLLISRQSSPPLEEGAYSLGVGYVGAASPVVHKRPVKKVPFNIEVSFTRGKVAGELRPGVKTAGRISADEGSMRTFVVDVPPQAKALRIDLDEVSSDLDILARHGQPILANDDADEAAISPLGRESLVIDGSPQHPLKPGRWYINVVHPVDFGVADFTIYASFSTEPPSVLLTLPELPHPEDYRQRAIHATVEVTTENGAASGTLLTENGLVLTNYHVVAEVAEGGAEKDPVVIGMTIDPRQPTRELFRGKVILFDKKLDLALAQITCGLYRQPLPKGYRFPTIPLGDSAAMEIGDTVSTLGFPLVGGSIGRVQRDAHAGRGQRLRTDPDRNPDQDRRGHRPGQFGRGGVGCPMAIDRRADL